MSCLIGTVGLIDGGPFKGFDTELSVVERIMSTFGIEDYVVAGGFVRDAIASKPFKDVDVFIPGDSDTPLDEEIVYELSDTVDLVSSGVLVNVVRLGWKFTTIKDVLDRMDTGICQVALTMDRSGWITPEYRVVHTEAFANDMADKTITVLRPELQARGDHLDRLQVKFSDHLLTFR